jgi:thymidylate synthase (FAD)
MNVRLIAVTQPVFYAERSTPPAELPMTAEGLIVYTARVSNPSNQMNMETAPKLISYLIKHKHWSPFEMASMTVEIETSRAIAAQILRHRSFAFQEFSQRYAQASLGTELYSARRQDAKNRQNSIDDMSDEDQEWFRRAQEEVAISCDKLYSMALEKGIAKEQARFLLPLGTTTRMYMTGSVRSWIHYLQVRTDPSTQKEHRDIAMGIYDIFSNQFPSITRALLDSGMLPISGV